MTTRHRIGVLNRVVRRTERDIARVDPLFGEIMARYMDGLRSHRPRSARLRSLVGEAVRIASETHSSGSRVVRNLRSIRDAAWVYRRSDRMDRRFDRAMAELTDSGDHAGTKINAMLDGADLGLRAGHYLEAIGIFDEAIVALREHALAGKQLFAAEYATAKQLYGLGEVERALGILELMGEHELGRDKRDFDLDENELSVNTQVQLAIGRCYLATRNRRLRKRYFAGHRKGSICIVTSGNWSTSTRSGTGWSTNRAARCSDRVRERTLSPDFAAPITSSWARCGWT